MCVCDVITALNSAQARCHQDNMSHAMCKALLRMGQCQQTYVQLKCCRTCHNFKPLHKSSPTVTSWIPVKNNIYLSYYFKKIYTYYTYKYISIYIYVYFMFSDKLRLQNLIECVCIVQIQWNAYWWYFNSSNLHLGLCTDAQNKTWGIYKDAHNVDKEVWKDAQQCYTWKYTYLYRQWWIRSVTRCTDKICKVYLQGCKVTFRRNPKRWRNATTRYIVKWCTVICHTQWQLTTNLTNAVTSYHE